MRLRNKPWADDMINDYPQYIPPAPADNKGKWDQCFVKEHPLHIEVGTGKGQFIVEMAKRHPEINFIGVELQSNALVSALEKQLKEDLPNLKFLRADARRLNDFFEEGEINCIYLTFSDPWPKTRHEKRRLTFKTFLSIYENILAVDGEIQFKTDNRKLFEYSLVSFSHYGMKLNDVYLDLHNSDIEENVMTEYEEKFSKKGNVIYKVHATFG